MLESCGLHQPTIELTTLLAALMMVRYDIPQSYGAAVSELSPSNAAHPQHSAHRRAARIALFSLPGVRECPHGAGHGPGAAARCRATYANRLIGRAPDATSGSFDEHVVGIR